MVTSLFPMFMTLAGKQCLVVGAGKVGEPKIGGLIDADARIHVVAISATDQVREWADAGKIELELRAFSSSDLDDKFLAVVATASRSLNERIYLEAQQRECCATWWMFQSTAISFTPQLCSAATCRSRFQPLGRVRRWRRNFGSNSKGSSAPDTRPGLSSSAKPDESFWPAISIRNES